MKSIQNKGINLTAEDLKNRIADRKERYTKQQARREKLEQTMENTRNDIEQLEYTLAQMERAAKRSRNAAVQPSRFVPRERIASFFARVSRFSTTFSTACTVAWTILGSALCYAPDILFRAAWKA